MYFLCREPFSLVKSDEPIHACFCYLFFSSSNDVCSTFLIFGLRNVALLAPFSNPTSLQLVLSVVRLELKIPS